MKGFDMHALDSLEPVGDEPDKAFDRYRRSLVDAFCSSVEGQANISKFGAAGFWAGCLLDFVQARTELARINRELKRLKVQMAELEERKSKLMADIEM